VSGIEVTILEQPVEVTVQESGEIALNITNVETVVEVSTTGPQGPKGDKGDRGYAGTQPVFSRAGVLETQVGQGRFYVERAGTITTVRASVGTPSAGSPVIVDVHKNGTTIFTDPQTRPTISAGGYTATSTPAVVALAAGDFLTVDIDAVGSTQPGADLTVSVTIE
jgi:hypothetical protein